MSGSMRNKIIALVIAIALVFSYGSVQGCGIIKPVSQVFDIEDRAVPLARFNPSFVIPEPDAPGLLVESNDMAFIDYSNKHLGYVTVGFSEVTDKSIKALKIVPGGNEYIYNLSHGVNEVLPLSKGDGEYIVSVHEQVEDNVFRVLIRATFYVELSDESVPFIRPNQYVDYCQDSPVTAKATELAAEGITFIGIVEAIYNFVITNIAYDFELAETVSIGYIPDLSVVLERGTGICFDMATLTAAMLRSQGIPAKLVIGYYYDPLIGNTYHAWVSVYAQEDGKIGGNVNFIGGTWNILDPTVATMFAVSGPVSATDDGKIYHALFYY